MILNLSSEISSFIDRQLAIWPEVRSRFERLVQVRCKTVSVNGTEIRIQFNPARVVSTGAPAGKTMMDGRPCFLCSSNRPEKQISFPWREYEILINPYPVLPGHLTIVSKTHIPQAIKDRITDMQELARLLEGFLVFYNGPESGASAPDHFHFQAVEAGHTPLENLMTQWVNPVDKHPGIIRWQGNAFSGYQILLSGKDQSEISNAFADIYEEMCKKGQNTGKEPGMNVFCRYTDGCWQLHIIPRRTHRPACYYETGKAKLMVSPGALDMAGIIITVREEDFDRIASPDIEQMYKEVALKVKKTQPLTTNS